MPVSDNLIDRIKKEFVLDWKGIHGYPHWLRVKENGLFLAETTGANIEIVELFAFLHDSKSSTISILNFLNHEGMQKVQQSRY